jgi:hypothetical protein
MQPFEMAPGEGRDLEICGAAEDDEQIHHGVRGVRNTIAAVTAH